MVAQGSGCSKMPCESCAVQFSVFKRKRACCECERFYCSGCLRRGGGNMCASCRVLSTRPLTRQAIAHLKVRDLQCFLQRQNVSTRGCVEKEELLSLCVSHVNSSAYRRRGSRGGAGAFSSLKGLTSNINEFINSAFDRNGPHPAPAPPARGYASCFNSAHMHDDSNEVPLNSRPRPFTERFTTTPGGETDIRVPVPESSSSVSRSASAESARVDTADCFEIEDLDDTGWEFVNRPADPLPNGTTCYYPSNRSPLLDTADCFVIEDQDDIGWEFVNRHADPLPNDSEVLISASDGLPSRARPTPVAQLSATRPALGALQQLAAGPRAPLGSPQQLAAGPRAPLGSPQQLAAGPRAPLGSPQPAPRAQLSSSTRAASELELHRAAHDDGSGNDSTSLQDEPIMDNDTDMGTPKHVHLEQFKQPSDLDSLNVKQLKELLIRNRVEYRGCLERKDLLERAKTLWRNHAEYKDDLDNLPIEECCKICMAAPLECVLLECGHIAACTACSKQLAECPICRQYVVRAVRFFRS